MGNCCGRPDSVEADQELLLTELAWAVNRLCQLELVVLVVML
jgi:hypothetical protein